MPERIQHKRVKGWRMPANTIYVGRGSRWGNPFSLDVVHHAAVCGLMSNGEPPDLRCDEILPTEPWAVTCAEAACVLYRGLIRHAPEGRRRAFLEPLRGYNLACWCEIGDPCHADVLLEFANRA